MNAALILLVVIVLLVLALVGVYNSFIAKRNQVRNIASTVDTQLKKRYDLIPNLVSATREYMSHENAINVLENDKQYTVELAAPGLKKEDFSVNVNEDGNLSIKMEQKSESTDQNEKTHYLRREFSYSKYEQTLLLPEDVNREAIAARVNDGVLTVDLPKVQKEEQKLFRSIQVD